MPHRFKYRGDDMKLEMDLLRDLLLYIEEKATRVHSDLEDIQIDGWPGEEVAYHVVQAEADGLIKATITEIPGDDDPALLFIEYSVHRLTMRGHDFLGNIKEPSNWEAVKDGTKKVGAITVDAAVGIAQAYIKAKIAAYTGLPL